MHRLGRWLKKYFIPHEGNDHKPHFLRKESMNLVLLFMLVAELGFIVQVFVVFDKTNFLASVLPGVLTTLTNEERALNDAPPLKENTLLDQAAQMKAEDMATKGYFAHTSPEGKSPWYWFTQVGYHYSAAGENLAVNFFESEDVAQAWMNSPSHRANIVKKDYTEIGIGVARGQYEGRDSVFVAQLFGKPAFAAAVEPQEPSPQPKAGQPPVETPKPSPVRIVQTPTPLPTSTQVLGEEKTATSSIKSAINRALTSPRDSISYAYGILGVIVALAILLASRKHPILLMRGFAVIGIILAITIMNLKIISPATAVPEGEGLSAAAIVAY